MLSAGVSTWPPCHGPVPPYSPASHWPTGHPQPFCSLELPRKLGLVLLYHLATSRAILPPALPTASLLPKDAALTASTKDQQMSAPQLSFLCPLISPINREPDFILLWKPLLSLQNRTPRDSRSRMLSEVDYTFGELSAVLVRMKIWLLLQIYKISVS